MKGLKRRLKVLWQDIQWGFCFYARPRRSPFFYRPAMATEYRMTRTGELMCGQLVPDLITHALKDVGWKGQFHETHHC